MADLRLVCTGARAGTLFLPPFQLRLGELVCLHLPHPLPDESEDDLVRALTGQQGVNGLRLYGRVLSAFPASDDRNGFLRLLRPLRATAWLRRMGGLSPKEASAVLRRLCLERDWLLTQLAGNPRTLLGLEAAWAAGAEAIIFRTCGIDYSGKQTAYAAVVSRLADCPAIHLSRFFFQNGQAIRDCVPGARCIDLTRLSAAPRPAESA